MKRVKKKKKICKSSKLLIPIKFSLWNWESSLLVDCRVPLLFRCFAPQNRTEESVLSSGLFCCVQSGLPDDRSPRTKQSAWTFFGSERRPIMGKVSGKTHTKAQLDHWANLHNPNNKAYQADADNRANQMNPNHRAHQRTHNANRRNKAHWMPEWAPDYPEYDD